jgi:NADPH2:quinone reductase
MMDQLPKTMRAAAIDRFGGPEELALHILPVPEIGDDEVLIALTAAGVGSWDADIRGGWWPDDTPPPTFPLVLGTDGAGTIAAAGRAVDRLKVGDRAYAYSFANPKGGFYAEYVAVAAERAARTPATLDLQQAGAIATTGLAALQGIDDALHVKAGEAVIVHGASGGVGTLAVQFAKLRGARVFATASGDDGVAVVRRLGADQVVEGHDAGLARAAHEFAPDGVDAILGLIGGEALERCVDQLRDGGRLGYLNGVEPEPRKRPQIAVIAYDAVPGVREFEALNEAVDAARVQVVIAATYPLEEAHRAHEQLNLGHVVGKITLTIV